MTTKDDNTPREGLEPLLRCQLNGSDGPVEFSRRLMGRTVHADPIPGSLAQPSSPPPPPVPTMPMPTFDDGIPVMTHDEAVLRPRPITYRCRWTHKVTTLA